MASVLAALGSSRQPVEIDRARIERQIRELALEHAGGRLGDDTYLARLEPRQAYPVIAQSNGCAPWASQSSRQTYRRGRQT